MIEVCHHCGAAWLDAGEFDAVRSALLARSPLEATERGKTTPSAWDLLDGTHFDVFDFLGGLFD